MSSDDRSLKRFSGDGDDPGKDLRKWKQWATAKILTLKDCKEAQQGPWLYTLLDGAAWDAVEHLEIDELAKAGGAQLIWKVLQQRFPEKEPYDQMGEALGEVFSLSANDGETGEQWTSRVRETFEKCKRKANTDFPSAAQGWIVLNCAGLSEEQKAIIKAKTQGSLQFDDISAAFRSCFPLYKANNKARRPLGALVVEDDGVDSTTTGSKNIEESDDFLNDVESFLAEHQALQPSLEEVSEGEAAEALAVSWQERRKEINKTVQSRRFGAGSSYGDGARRSFKVEVEELKKRTRCRKCGKVGHWARECRSGRSEWQNPKSSSGSGSAPSASSTTAANYVEHEEVQIDEDITFVGATMCLDASQDEALAAQLVSSPGFGVVDTGCGKTLVGEDTLQELEVLLAKVGRSVKWKEDQVSHFRFGNGQQEVSRKSVVIPVGISKKLGLIEAAVIGGKAPLLLGRPTLEKMQAQLDFEGRRIHLFGGITSIPMDTNSAGQLLVSITDFPVNNRCAPSLPHEGEADRSTVGAKDRPDPENVPERPGRNPNRKKITLKQKECRCLVAQFRKYELSTDFGVTVAELFSPPRFTLEAQKHGGKGLAFDKKQGWDLLDSQTQDHVDRLLERSKPALLIVCPPCTHEGGWENLNQYFRTPLERAKLIRENRCRLRFCVQQIQKQIRRGGDFLFEHPLGSRVWSSKEMANLKREYGRHRIDMCRYGLKCPDTGLPIRKATGLMVSRKEVQNYLGCCKCTTEHRVIEGKLKSGQLVSDFCSQYTDSFVKSILNAFGDAGVRACCFRPTCESHLVQSSSQECLVGESDEVEDQAPEVPNPELRKIQAAVAKLHKNLGHPSTNELVRIMKHSGATHEAIKVAQSLQCSVCMNHLSPSSALPANVPHSLEFNHHIGLDVKYLKGWKVNQRIPCVSIVDYGTSFQIMAPIFERENAELLKGVLRDSWIAWAGPPQNLTTDPAKPNISDALAEFLEGNGIKHHKIAADAHWQLGKVERHGQWFEKIFDRVCDECQPSDAEAFVDCVLQTQCAKNSLIATAGASPYQLVFGRNPRIPQDLLQDDVDLSASEAILTDQQFARSQEIRQSARKAVLECQDDRALRLALRARPRSHRNFKSGDWVYYWRSQKWEKGILVKHGKWHGAALVLGIIGRNIVVAHRRSILRCAPEQLRFASQDEATVAEFPQNELLGIRMLLEKGQFPKGQFTDLVALEHPPEPESVVTPNNDHEHIAQTAGEIAQESRMAESVDPAPEIESRPRDVASSSVDLGRTYGPLRRHRVKKPADPIARPPQLHLEDFSELMSEVLPKMIDALPSMESSSAREASPRPEASKREASVEPEGHVDSKPRVERSDGDEELFCEEVLAAACLSSDHKGQNQGHTFDVLMAAFLQKKLQKEIPAVGNEPAIQAEVDASKVTEWDTMLDKGAVIVHKGDKAKKIKSQHPDRFIGSRFVCAKKVDEEGTRNKARWCLQGYTDPDFKNKLVNGLLNSPTLSQLARSLVLQVLVSKKWTMCLGDIKGAFLESGPIQPQFRPLYAKQPQGGIPGVNPEDVIEVVGNVYGSNDAPLNWYRTFDEGVRQIGFARSQFDNCLYYLRSATGELCGVMGAHVDDTIVGGAGPEFDQAIKALRERFPYRKWRVGSGEFCGVHYNQDPQSKEITYGQSDYARFLRPINISKERLRNKDWEANEKEVSALRAVNGAINWLSSQSRPDLCTQASFSQQCFPKPKIRDLLFANQMIHRAKQYHDVTITVKDIDWDRIAVCFHSDAGFANTKAHATQAGYILSFVDKCLESNQPSNWSPFAWKSYRLPRVVSSTLSAEAQSFSTASAIAEWMALMIAEAKHGFFDLRSMSQVEKTPIVASLKKEECVPDLEPIVGISDCKSLYDHLTSMSSVSKVDDKRVAIDLAILRQCVSRTGLKIRWCPTELMLADALTKDNMDPADLMRAALHIGEYQLNKEATILSLKKRQREERIKKRQTFVSAQSKEET